jgi:arginyl-tRNA synthetase
MSPLGKAKTEIVKTIKAAFPNSPLDVSDITPTPNPSLGDLAVPMYKLAKVAGKAPSALAEELRERWPGSAYVSEVSVAGPYLNVRLDRSRVTKETLAGVMSKTAKYGLGKKTKERVMVEYISPNMNKPLHLGHLRNATLGDAVSSLIDAAGSKVIRAQLLNDLGVGVSKAMLAYERWGKSETPESGGLKGDHLVGKYYVMFEKQKAHDPSIEDAARELVRKWEAGDKTVRALWRTIIKWCMDGQKETYKTIGATFQKTYRESALSGIGKKIVADALAKGLFQKDEKGNVIAKLPGLPDKVVLRADGTAVYITTDLELTVKKMRENRLTRSVWVVGNEQNLHFKQLFGIIRLMGYPWADKLEHLSYGLVNLPEGRMKSREGTVVDADELIEKLSGLAADAVRERHDFLDQKEVENRAQEIALGALKFYLLEASAATDIVFDPNAAISFTGRTGPYLQYTNARILSVLRKAMSEKSHAGRVDSAKLTEPTEWQLMFTLARFPDAIADAAAMREPSTLSKYCYELAKSFSDFYENVPVLKADDATRRARLCLLRAVQTVLSRGLNILGIPTPKEM